MSLVIKFYFTSSMFNMFRTLIHSSSGACDHIGRVFLIRCVLEFRCGLAPCSRLQPATRIPPQSSHTETPTHIETRTHNQCGETTETSQAPDDRCIKVRNMLNVEEVK